MPQMYPMSWVTIYLYVGLSLMFMILFLSYMSELEEVAGEESRGGGSGVFMNIWFW